MNDFNAIYDAKPTNPLCDKQIDVCVVGKRCVYLNSHRIAGGKPYISENLPQHEFNLTVRDALKAFSVKELEAYISEKNQREKYFADYHSNKNKSLEK